MSFLTIFGQDSVTSPSAMQMRRKCTVRSFVGRVLFQKLDPGTITVFGMARVGHVLSRCHRDNRETPLQNISSRVLSRSTPLSLCSADPVLCSGRKIVPPFRRGEDGTRPPLLIIPDKRGNNCVETFNRCVACRQAIANSSIITLSFSIIPSLSAGFNSVCY